MISCRAPGVCAVLLRELLALGDLLPHGECLEVGGILPPLGRARGLLTPTMAGIEWASVYMQVKRGEGK